MFLRGVYRAGIHVLRGGIVHFPRCGIWSSVEHQPHRSFVNNVDRVRQAQFPTRVLLINRTLKTRYRGYVGVCGIDVYIA